MGMDEKSVVGEWKYRSAGDERNVSERELAGVSGGSGRAGVGGGLNFPWLVREFARINDCAGCPKKQIHRQHEMCMEVYGRLAAEYSKDGSVSMKCAKR